MAGGGDYSTSGGNGFGGRGGHGALNVSSQTVKGGESYTIVIGKGGVGGTGGRYQTGRLPSGNAGGNSSFGELVSQGGAGGQGCLMSSSGTQISNGASGTDYTGNSGNTHGDRKVSIPSKKTNI